MHVLLPDSSKLELPDGASGLEAARAIGPKLAEQAVLDSADGQITFYTQGDFTDLCKGPHLQTSAPIKAVKLTGLAGAYWRGDSTKPQLTRVYGTAFYRQEDLDAHLQRLEEAKRRDHRRL